MNKICTSIDQGKRLLELGLPINTANMFYRNNGKDIKLMWEHLPEIKVTSPAWSLTALLELINSDYKLEKFMIDQSFEFTYAIHIDGVHYTREHDNPLDAAYEMIIYLLENKLI